MNSNDRKCVPMDINSPIYVDHVRRHSPYIMPRPHSHPKYELYFLADLKGSGKITINGNCYSLKPNTLIIIDQNLIHQTDFSDSLVHERFLLEIDPTLFLNEADQLIHFPVDLFFKQATGVYPLDDDTLSKVANLFMSIYDDSLLMEKYFEDLVRLKILEMILILTRFMEEKESAQTRSEQMVILRPIIKYINEHWADNLSLTQIAEDFYISKSYLARAFKNCTGNTLHHYVNLLRIKQAQRMLLLYENESIEEIARRCGFNSTSYFIRKFREEVNLAPKQYRKKFRTN